MQKKSRCSKYFKNLQLKTNLKTKLFRLLFVFEFRDHFVFVFVSFLKKGSFSIVFVNFSFSFSLTVKHQLSITRGITCSTDCPCHDPATRALVQEGRQLYATVSILARQYKIQACRRSSTPQRLLDLPKTTFILCSFNQESVDRR